MNGESMSIYRLPTVKEVESMILVRVNGVPTVRSEFPQDMVKEYTGGLNEIYYFIRRIWELLVQDTHNHDELSHISISEIMLSKEMKELAHAYARIIEEEAGLLPIADLG